MKSVVICGSSRFKKEIIKFSANLRKFGVQVFEPALFGANKDWVKISGQIKDLVATGLTYQHFQKIRQADVVFVFNKNGYVGNSTTLELGFAAALGKIVYALENDTVEVCREILFKEIIKNEKELVKKLK